MDDSFEQYIGYIVFFIVFVLPRILRALKGKKRTPKEATPAPNPLEELFRGESMDSEEDTLEDVVPPGYEAEIDRLKREVGGLLERARSMMQTCLARGGALKSLTGIVHENAVRPLEELDARLDGWRSRPEEASEHAMYRTGLILEKMRDLLHLLDRLISQRRQPGKADLLTQLDIPVREALLPFLIHARRMALVYPTQYALTLMGDEENLPGELLGESTLAAVIVDESTATLPRAWALMISNFYLDVFHSTRGMSHRITTDLGILPAPYSALSQHRGRNLRALAGSVAGTFVPRIFADIAAALFLGPGFVFGLRSSVGSGSEEDLALRVVLNEPGQVPVYVRIFAACRALSHAGYGKEAQEHWRGFNRRLGDPSEILVTDLGKAPVPLPVNTVLGAVARMVDFIVKEPLAPLGGYPLGGIPTLACDGTCAAHMKQIAGDLRLGIPRNAPARVIVGAALHAVERYPTNERRIGNAALKALAGKGVEAVQAKGVSPETPASLQEAVESPAFIMRAIAVSAAVAPRRR